MQAISGGHHKTLEAAKTILENGGNAFDAAIAAAFTMFISEPCMSSAGAAGFAMIYTPEKGPIMLDFFSQTPISKPHLPMMDFYPVEVNFGNETEVFHVGKASMATPGLIKGLYAIHERFASMPMKELLEPVKQYAKEGVAVDEFQFIDMGLLEAILAIDPSVKEVFFKNGKRIQKDELLHMPRLISFLDFLDKEGDRGFYHGEIGKLVAEVCKEQGGFLRREDFEKYQVFWRKPLHYNYKGKTICLPNGPSLGGALMTLNLESYKRSGNWAKSIYETRKKYKTIDSIQAGMNDGLSHLKYDSTGSSISSKGTSHFNIMDDHGNAIAFTCSLGEGSGYFIPGTDMQMNNMLGEDFLLPDGFHSWEENSRLNSMMTPTMLLNQDNQLEYLGGSGGAGRIPFMIAQVIDHLQEGMNLHDATNKARCYVQGNTLHTEDINLLTDYPAYLDLQEWDYHSLFFGGVHSISSSAKDKIEAAADPRRFGVSSVF